MKYGRLYQKTDDAYFISNFGRVKSLKWGKKTYILVHRLVASVFLVNTNNYRTVNHKDGNKLNNNVSNLEWCSDSENLKHARDNGLLKTKINNEIAEQIKNENGTIREIAKKYGIGKTQVGYIKQGKRWQK